MRSVLVLAGVLSIAGSAAAQPAPASSVVIVSGVRPHERWDEDEYTRLADGDYYFAVGTIAIALRDPQSKPVAVTVWGRGDVRFFDPSRIPGTTSGAWPMAEEWSKVFDQMHSQRLLVHTLRADVPSAIDRSHVGYVVRVPRGRTGESSAQVFVAPAGTAPESVSLALHVDPGPFAEIGSTFLLTVVSTLVGAVIGLGTFYWQQVSARHEERLKRFEERKTDKSKELWSFFTDDYQVLKKDAGSTDLQRVNSIRQTMIEQGLLAVVLPETASKIAEICDEKSTINGERIAALDALLKQTFSEYMR